MEIDNLADGENEFRLNIAFEENLLTTCYDRKPSLALAEHYGESYVPALFGSGSNV